MRQKAPASRIWKLLYLIAVVLSAMIIIAYLAWKALIKPPPMAEVPPLETAVGTAAFLGFGHRRLSILDLSVGGHQPMHLPERDITLIYNGELYNYLELRAQLEALGYTFHTTSDTEVLLYAYCQWGEDCLTQFNDFTLSTHT